MAQPIPLSISHLLALNVEYKVLICIGRGCSCALKPAALSRHLDIKHKTSIELRKQVDQYVRGFPFAYDHATVSLPQDGLAPQPIIPIVDGFACRECAFKSTNRGATRKHVNKAHNKKRAADEDVLKVVRLQSWFGEKRERYWVVDESQQGQQERQARRAAIRDVGEGSSDSEANTGRGSGSGSGSDDDNDSEDDLYDDIIQEIEDWKAAAKERALEALKKVPAAEIDSWLQFTGWNEVLGRSKHDLIKTYEFARAPDPDEPELERVVGAWRRILERCLDTLVATDQKDALKWWASPKNEALSQRPFELPQTSKSVDKYSAVWERLICYMMRTIPKLWEDETGECG